MMRDPYAPWDKQTRLGYLMATFLIALILCSFGALAYCHFVLSPQLERNSAWVSLDTVAGMLAHGRPPNGNEPWPPYSGRNFVLSLVPDGRLNAAYGDLSYLFVLEAPPADATPEAYDEVTHEALRTRRFPHLTNLAGRRNADPDAKIPEDPKAPPTPIVAWLGFEDGAMVGYSDGRAHYLDREALGLDDDDPITAGQDSKSPILRLLSDE